MGFGLGGGGSQVAEEVITRMILDDRQYQAGARRVINTNAQLITSFNQLQTAAAAAQTAMGGINFGGGNTFNFMGGGGGGGQSGGGLFGGGGFMGFYMALRLIREVEHALVDLTRRFVEFTRDALQEYASFDTLSKSFEGVYGSAQKANQMMSYLRDTAMTSAFHFRDLADAARGVSVAGLDVNRWLPIVQGFALMKGDISGGGLQDFIGILRRLQGGNTGVALGPRGIGRYGVSQAELESHGATFDANRHFTGSINQAFDAIEGVFDARVKGIADKVRTSFEVSMSNAEDSIQQATIDFGKGVAENVGDPIRTLTDSLNGLRQAGVITDLADTIFSILDLGGSVGDKTAAQSTMLDIGQALVTVAEFVKLAYLELVDIFNVLKFLNIPYALTHTGNSDSLVGNAIKAGEDWRRRADEMLTYDRHEREQHPEKYLAPMAPGGNDIVGINDDAVQSKSTLKGIHDHVRAIREHFDARRTAFGGGDIGRLGVTPVEMGEYYRGATGHSGSTGSLEHQFTSFGSNIQAYFEAAVQRAFSNGLKQGLIGGQRA